MLRTQEIRAVSQENRELQAQIKELQSSVDALSIHQGGATSKMQADLTVLIGELKEQVLRLQAEIDETQFRLGQLNSKIEKLDQKKVVIQGMSASPSVDSLRSDSTTKVKVVGGLDLENLYSQARSDFVAAKYDLAFQGFQTVYEKDAGQSFKDPAFFWMAECLLKQNKLEKALQIYQKYVKEFPKGNKICSAKYKVGFIYANQKEILKRNEAWKELISSCPQSNEAQRATDQLKE